MITTATADATTDARESVLALLARGARSTAQLAELPVIRARSRNALWAALALLRGMEADGLVHHIELTPGWRWHLGAAR